MQKIEKQSRRRRERRSVQLRKKKEEDNSSAHPLCVRMMVYVRGKRHTPVTQHRKLSTRSSHRKLLSLSLFPHRSVVPRCKNDCTWVRAHGNQLIHRTAVREHSLVLPSLSSSCSFSSSFASSSATIRIYLVGVYILSLSVRTYTRATRILVEIESGEESDPRSRGSISFYMRVERARLVRTYTQMPCRDNDGIPPLDRGT